MTTLAGRRLSPDDIDDLCWLLLEEHRGDLGEKSAFGDQIDRLIRIDSYSPVDVDSWHVVPMHETRSRKPYEVGDALIEAATRLRALRAREAAVGRPALVVLAGAFVMPRTDMKGWDRELRRVVLQLPSAATAHARSGDAKHDLLAWLTLRVNQTEYAAIMERLRAEADAVVSQACLAWERTVRIGRDAKNRRAAA